MKTRFYIARHVCSDTPKRWFAVFDRMTTTDGRSLPCCLRVTKAACETWIKNTKRELKTERQFNRRRVARIKRQLNAA